MTLPLYHSPLRCGFVYYLSIPFGIFFYSFTLFIFSLVLASSFFFLSYCFLHASTFPFFFFFPAAVLTFLCLSLITYFFVNVFFYLPLCSLPYTRFFPLFIIFWLTFLHLPHISLHIFTPHHLFFHVSTASPSNHFLHTHVCSIFISRSISFLTFLYLSLSPYFF